MNDRVGSLSGIRVLVVDDHEEHLGGPVKREVIAVAAAGELAPKKLAAEFELVLGERSMPLCCAQYSWYSEPVGDGGS